MKGKLIMLDIRPGSKRGKWKMRHRMQKNDSLLVTCYFS